MKAKGLIQFFAIALILVCIYQLSFTFVVNNFENKAKKATNGDMVATQRYLDSLGGKTIYNLGFADWTYQEAKELQLNLGLDLQGGMNVVMEVSVVDVIRALANNTKDADFNKALELALQKQTNSQKDYVTLFFESYKEIAPNGNLVALFATRENAQTITFNSTVGDVEKLVREESEGAIDRSFQILRTRIDKFGVTQPNIQRQQGTGRIVIELPGVTNPERVRKLLQGTAKLEFWETYENSEIINNLGEVNKYLGEKLGADTTQNNDLDGLFSSEPVSEINQIDTASLASKADTSTGNDLLAEMGADTSSKDSANSEASMEEARRQNPLFALMSPNIPQDQTGGQGIPKGPVVGFAVAKDTAQINRYFDMPEVKSLLPRNLRLLWSVKGIGETENVFQLIAIKLRSADGVAPLEGDVITDARQNLDQFGKVEVSMAMNTEGARKWKKLTGENIGRSVAIVLDNSVYSFPTVNQEISGGSSSISGGFSIDEAKDLSLILKAGKLPAPARIIEEAVVGPSLGAESIRSGLISTVSGFVLVLLFMLWYYRNAGLVANIALLANVFFIFGVLASLGAVLTLPGIAGIVLTIGMSVDANVLIYERIREELKKGHELRQAISDGYKYSFSSIIDSNITTLLTAIILFSFGTGPIQGFATTLIIGILSSLFSAIFITRLIIDWQVSKGKQISFASTFTDNVFSNINFDFMRNRRIFYIISSIIIIAGIASLATKGLQMGIDFEGGRTFVVQLDKDAQSAVVRAELSKSFGKSPEVKTFGANDKMKITTSYLIDDMSEDSDQQVLGKLYEGLQKYLPANLDIETFELNNILSAQKVGPTIVDDIKTSASRAILFSLMGIFIYIFVRFRKISYSVGALVALVHDVAIIFAVFSIFHGLLPFDLEIDQAFIAAILTIVGYSINDTVVVFDRLREELSIHHAKGDSLEVINDALNKTLSRTLITAATTIFVVLMLFLFGGQVIKGFSFALLIGMIVGTYSSVFIATGIVTEFRNKAKKA